MRNPFGYGDNPYNKKMPEPGDWVVVLHTNAGAECAGWRCAFPSREDAERYAKERVTEHWYPMLAQLGGYVHGKAPERVASGA